MADPQILKLVATVLREMGVDEMISSSPQKRFYEQELSLPSSLSEKPVETSQTPERVPRKDASLMPSPLPAASIDAAQTAAQTATTLDDLKDALLKFEGCALKHTALNTVFGAGNPKARVMLIGEAPGADEDRQGFPFVGQSGQLLDKALAAIGLTRKDNFYITNIIPWRPPGNRQPTPQETAACLPFVKRHIELVDPDFLILVGGTSAKALLGGSQGIIRLRGAWRDYTLDSGKSLKVIAIFHPAYLLRSPGQKREFWADLIKIKHSLQAAGVDLKNVL